MSAPHPFLFSARHQSYSVSMSTSSQSLSMASNSMYCSPFFYLVHWSSVCASSLDHRINGGINILLCAARFLCAVRGIRDVDSLHNLIVTGEIHVNTRFIDVKKVYESIMEVNIDTSHRITWKRYRDQLGLYIRIVNRTTRNRNGAVPSCTYLIENLNHHTIHFLVNNIFPAKETAVMENRRLPISGYIAASNNLAAKITNFLKGRPLDVAVNLTDPHSLRSDHP